MNTDGYELRPAKPDDWDAIMTALNLAFGDDFEPETSEIERMVWEPERTLVATLGDEVAGTGGAFTRLLSVPGGEVPAAHVTMVGVHPVHRRHGLLRRMMHQQLADVRALGEPIAVLWASEGRIYQRYGYGLAAQRVEFEADREVQLRELPSDVGRLRPVEPGQATELLREVYQRVAPHRPGWSQRDDRWWGYVMSDPKSSRRGASALRVTIHEGPAGVDGYAIWRTKGEWQSTGPNGTVRAREVVAENPVAYQALWHLLLNVDLTRVTNFWAAALDEPLPYLVNEPRRLGARMMDSLWVRVVDVPGALAARRYAAPVDVVLAVSDPILEENTGNWHLVGDSTSASCERTGRTADLDCDLGALGAAYLGGTPLAALAGAGRVHELTPGALAAASTAFGWHRAPSATEIF